jgi:hypothetical protein
MGAIALAAALVLITIVVGVIGGGKSGSASTSTDSQGLGFSPPVISTPKRTQAPAPMSTAVPSSDGAKGCRDGESVKDGARAGTCRAGRRRPTK